MSVIDRLEEELKAETSLPWRNGVAGYVYDCLNIPMLITDETAGADVQDERGEFIVVLVNALPDLLKLARAAQGRYSGQPRSSHAEYDAADQAVRAALEPLFREEVQG